MEGFARLQRAARSTRKAPQRVQLPRGTLIIVLTIVAAIVTVIMNLVIILMMNIILIIILKTKKGPLSGADAYADAGAAAIHFREGYPFVRAINMAVWLHCCSLSGAQVFASFFRRHRQKIQSTPNFSLLLH